MKIISGVLLSFGVFLIGCTTKSKEEPKVPVYEMAKMEYHNPTAIVDLDVGFKSVPMPMDFDGDGDLDLLVSEASSYVEAGVYYFENIGTSKNPLFRHGARVSSERFRLGHDGKFFVVSVVDGKTNVLTSDASNSKLVSYQDVPQNVFWAKENMPASLSQYIKGTKANTWKIIDFNNDGLQDLVCGRKTPTKSELLWFKNTGTKEEAYYEQPVVLLDSETCPNIKGMHIAVALGDYDLDGDQDYMAVTPFGKLAYFENKNGKGDCFFESPKILKNEGEALQFYSVYGGALKIRTVDFNQDGYVDILAGDEEGKVSFVKNTGLVENGLPVFEQPQFLQQKARYLDLGALVTPRVFDWDADGLDDIISGNGAGDILFVKNLGGTIPSWDIPKRLEQDSKPIRLLAETALPNTEEPHWGYTTLDVGDWDGDNLPDILANEHNGNMVFIKNIGTRTKPLLDAPEPLEIEWEGAPQKPNWIPGVSKGNQLLAPWRTSPLMIDYNKDGLQDLVMLDYEGYLVTFLRKKVAGKLKLTHPQRNFIYPDGKPILLNQRTGKSHGRLKISWADWDGDGLKDLVFSSKPAVDWMKNMGKKEGKTVLQYMGRVVSRTLMGHTDGPTISDFDKNGIPDLLVGTETGVLYYWNRPNIQTTTTMTTNNTQKPAQYPYFKR